MNTDVQKDKQQSQGAGLFLAGANVLLLAAISWHAVVHPSVGATTQADAAVAGDLKTFAVWFSISRGFELMFILFPVSLFAITLGEFRASVPLTPRWASGVAMLGAAL